jgi:hypothetical protein
LNSTISDTNLDTCWYSLDYGANVTFTCGTNITGIEANLGSNTWIVYANDSVGNTNSSTVVFSVYLRHPYFVTIPDGASITYGTPWVGANFIATDEVEFGNYSINDTTNFQINSSGFLNWTEQLAVGNYYVNVSINNTIGGLNSTVYNLNITRATAQLNLTFALEAPITYPTPITAYCDVLQGDTVNPEIWASSGVLSVHKQLTHGANVVLDAET